MPLEPTKLLDVSLDDKFELESGRVYMSGIQALIRLPMMQRARDLAAGLNTAGFISGYRGSPLGGVDQAAWKAKKHLERNSIKFVPGLNEDLAATAVWGTQQVTMWPGAKHDGVFAMWYGKGPGVDRSGDVLKHANFAGTAKHGGVLVIAGDDHASKSSTLPHQSDHMFSAAMIPVINPASVQEYLDLGLHGWAMSRYSGCWVGFKALTDTVESSASVIVDPHRVNIVIPTQQDFPFPPDGVNIRWPDTPLAQEARMQDYKIYAALEYCRQNRLNQIVIDSPRPRLGIICSGKSYLDVMQALDDLGIDAQHASEIGIRVYKVAMTWPLEPEGVRHFAEGLEEILVVEEKRHMMEYQLKEQLYNWREDVRPRVVGKFDEKGEWVKPHGEWLLPAYSELTPAMVARAIAHCIAKYYSSERIKQRLDFLSAKEKALAKPKLTIQRTPMYCSGCPHNTSTTKLPEGSFALAGIGCHYMATWITPSNTKTFTQMGGEGVPWIGASPFTETKHVFANLGDGTYFHSGILAIRAAVAANINITYKILYNDAVAMTGGQPHDGPLDPFMIANQLRAEGVKRIAVVTDQPDQFGEGAFGPDIVVSERDDLVKVETELREVSGVSALIYVQTCAAEKRRRRKRGKFPDPNVRAFINEMVCEGCGDCGQKSNCVSVMPLETEYGRKRQIDQSSCNKDYSCVKGFCPSFVTVEGGRVRKGKGVGAAPFEVLPDPVLPSTQRPYGVLITGIGGTGVVTISNILGMAAHVQGTGVTVLDMAGLAQKNGAVFSHVRFADRQEDLYAVRIAAGEANLVLGCDIVVGISAEALAKMQGGVTKAVINSAVVLPGDFTKNPDLKFPLGSMEREISDAIGAENAEFLDATRLATALMGDTIATNLFMVGYAYQRGLMPLTEAAILRAIELNGAAIESNKAAFLWGRRAAHNLARVEDIATPKAAEFDTLRLSDSLDDLIARRVKLLTAYQDAAYAERYQSLVSKVRKAESERVGGEALTLAVARYYAKLLAVKDEYEVARMYSDGEFLKRLEAQFEGDYKLSFHLAPPLWVKPDPVTGQIKKQKFGPWMMTAFKLLAKLKGVRGTALDVFGYTAERKMERRLIAEYEATMEEVIAKLAAHNHELAVELASIPEHIRGFGHVKERHVVDAKAREAELLEKFRSARASATVVPIKAAA